MTSAGLGPVTAARVSIDRNNAFGATDWPPSSTAISLLHQLAGARAPGPAGLAGFSTKLRQSAPAQYPHSARSTDAAQHLAGSFPGGFRTTAPVLVAAFAKGRLPKRFTLADV
jgi:hypothetical protein